MSYSVDTEDRSLMESIRAQIASNIRRFRTERGMNVDEVGAAVGKSGKTISAWEVGRGQPDADAMIALCRLFSVDIADFYGEEQTSEEQAERNLIDSFRSMSDEGKRVLSAITETLSGIYGDHR